MFISYLLKAYKDPIVPKTKQDFKILNINKQVNRRKELTHMKVTLL